MSGHLIQSTVFALVAVAICLILKTQRAALRHAILLAAMLRFLIPTPWLAQAGAKLASCLPSHLLFLPVVDDVSRLIRRPGRLPLGPARPQFTSLADAAEWLWAGGAFLSLGLWLRGQMRRAPEAREANAAELDAFSRGLRRRRTQEIALRIIPAGWSPGVQGLLLPTILLPEGVISELTEAELDTVLAHEMAHLERKDLWVAAVARIITCMFWFHPLVWWMERRMLKERETACDELVLARGADASDYAGAIAKVCRLAAWGGSQAYAAMADSYLMQRMEHIMKTSIHNTRNRTAARLAQASLGLIATFAVLLPVAVGFIQAQPQAVSNSPADALNNSLYRACLGNLKAGKYQEAEKGFRRLREMEPGNPRSVVGIALVYLREGHQEEAMRLVDSEVHSNPTMVSLGLALGDFYIDANMYSKAIDELKLVLGSAGDSQTAAQIYARMGEAYRRAGDLNQAMWAFRQASARNPDDSAPILSLALVLEGTGQKEAARQEYVKVLKLAPSNGIALNNLAYIEAVSGGDLAQASDYAGRAKAALPQSTDVADTVGWIYVQRQMGDEAIAVLKDVVVAQPSNMDFRRHLASAMDLKGLNSASMEKLKQALRSETTPAETIVPAVKALQ